MNFCDGKKYIIFLGDYLKVSLVELVIIFCNVLAVNWISQASASIFSSLTKINFTS